MADPSYARASFSTQAIALLHKNLIFQVNGTTVCGVQYSTLDQVINCPIPDPPKWRPLLQVPAPEYRATEADFSRFPNLPNASCRRTGSCPVTILMTGNNQTLGQSRERVEQMILESSSSHAIICDNLRKIYPGRDGNPPKLVVKGLSLAVSRGECFGMLGPKGAGKTVKNIKSNQATQG